MVFIKLPVTRSLQVEEASCHPRHQPLRVGIWPQSPRCGLNVRNLWGNITYRGLRLIQPVFICMFRVVSAPRICMYVSYLTPCVCVLSWAW